MQGQPFAAVIFTLSTHQPFKIPPQYEGRFPAGELPIHESVGYLDHSLRNFFAIAQQMLWFNRTLFVITGDHAGPAAAPRARLIDAYRVPLIFYHPSVALPSTGASKIAQHADIAPSILDHVGLRGAHLLSFGHSVFDSTYEGLALEEVDDRYWMALGDYYIEQSAEGTATLSQLSDGAVPVADAAKVRARLLRELERQVRRFNELFTESPGK
jgi:phosphoglycerol transferase MdoB-like AlkP superfamily enzyme